MRPLRRKKVDRKLLFKRQQQRKRLQRLRARLQKRWEQPYSGVPDMPSADAIKGLMLQLRPRRTLSAHWTVEVEQELQAFYSLRAEEVMLNALARYGGLPEWVHDTYPVGVDTGEPLVETPQAFNLEMTITSMPVRAL